MIKSHIGFKITCLALFLACSSSYARNVIKTPDDTNVSTQDSSAIKPMNVETAVPKAPTIVTTAQGVTTQTNITACPTTFTNCPDINVDPNSAAYNPATCPKQCSVTANPTGGGVTPSTTVNRAVCPAGYSQVGSYNSQPEYKYSDTTYTKYPANQTDYNNYLSQGYVCTPDSNAQSKWSACYGSAIFKNNYNNTNSEYAWGNTNQVINGRYSYVVSSTVGCYNYDKNCDGSYSKTCNYSSNAQATWDFNIVYKYYTCKKLPGNYATGQYVPATVICARISSTWSQ